MILSSKPIIPLGKLGSGFSKANSSIATVDQPLSKLRFWREFSAGMKMFSLHLDRNNADINDILSQNIKLLHNSLKSEKIYQQLLRNLPTQPSGQWNSLASSKEIVCGLVNINTSQHQPLGNIVAPFMSTTHSRGTAFSDQKLIPSFVKQGLISLFVIRGKLKLETMQQNTLSISNKNAQTLKPGNIALEYLNFPNNVVKSMSKNSQLLLLVVPPCQFH